MLVMLLPKDVRYRRIYIAWDGVRWRVFSKAGLSLMVKLKVDWMTKYLVEIRASSLMSPTISKSLYFSEIQNLHLYMGGYLSLSYTML